MWRAEFGAWLTENEREKEKSRTALTRSWCRKAALVTGIAAVSGRRGSIHVIHGFTHILHDLFYRRTIFHILDRVYLSVVMKQAVIVRIALIFWRRSSNALLMSSLLVVYNWISAFTCDSSVS
jgi:hypothetical protein